MTILAKYPHVCICRIKGNGYLWNLDCEVLYFMPRSLKRHYYFKPQKLNPGRLFWHPYFLKRNFWTNWETSYWHAYSTSQAFSPETKIGNITGMTLTVISDSKNIDLGLYFHCRHKCFTNTYIFVLFLITNQRMSLFVIDTEPFYIFPTSPWY